MLGGSLPEVNGYNLFTMASSVDAQASHRLLSSRGGVEGERCGSSTAKKEKKTRTSSAKGGHSSHEAGVTCHQ